MFRRKCHTTFYSSSWHFLTLVCCDFLKLTFWLNHNYEAVSETALVLSATAFNSTMGMPWDKSKPLTKTPTASVRKSYRQAIHSAMCIRPIFEKYNQLAVTSILGWTLVYERNFPTNGSPNFCLLWLTSFISLCRTSPVPCQLFYERRSQGRYEFWDCRCDQFVLAHRYFLLIGTVRSLRTPIAVFHGSYFSERLAAATKGKGRFKHLSSIDNIEVAILLSVHRLL